MGEEKTVKRSGYVYNSKTKEGFQKMRKLGAVLPPFRIEDEATRLLTSHYGRMIKKLEEMIKVSARVEGLVTDSLFDVIISQLQEALLKSVGSDKERLEKSLRRLLGDSQEHFFEQFLEDADDQVKIRIAFALDKDDVFKDRIDNMLEDYLGNSLERIEREENFLKEQFLRHLTDYTLGNRESLTDIKGLIEEMQKTSVREARFFARDQFSRLNKSMTLASFEQAEVKYVQWITVGDQRTRPTHKALNKAVFPVDDLPKEHDDFGCRCCLVPYWRKGID